MHVLFDLGVYARLASQPVRPRPFPVGSWKKIPEEEADDMAAIALLSEEASWRNALACGDVDTMWRSWCAAAESFLLARSALEGTAAQGRYRGRGYVREPRKRPVVAKEKQVECGAQVLQQLQLHHLFGRCEDLRRQLRQAPATIMEASSWEARRFWSRICDHQLWQSVELREMTGPWRDQSLPSLDQIDIIIQHLYLFKQLMTRKVRDERIKAWKNWVQYAWHSDIF